MISRAISNIKKLQEFALEIGLSRAILAIAAPRMMLLEDHQVEEDSAVFARSVSEVEIIDVSRDLFASGHYSLSVQEAYKAVEKYVQFKSGKENLSGSSLMSTIFSAANPVLSWTDRKTPSEQDEQKGYMYLYMGSMIGIRNPVVHEFGWVESGGQALELILFAQHLLRKAKEAKEAKL